MSVAVERRFVIVQHARERMLERCRNHDLQLDEGVDAFIEQEVRAALNAGRFAVRKPKAFRFFADRGKGRMCHPNDRCVWTADMQLAWIVRRNPMEDVVMTTLTRTRS